MLAMMRASNQMLRACASELERPDADVQDVIRRLRAAADYSDAGIEGTLFIGIADGDL